MGNREVEALTLAVRCRLCRRGTLRVVGLVESSATSGVMERIILRCDDCASGWFILTTSMRLLRPQEAEDVASQVQAQMEELAMRTALGEFANEQITPTEPIAV